MSALRLSAAVAGKELFRLRGRWKGSGAVEIDAANELAVACQFRRFNIQSPQLSSTSGST